MTNGFNGGNNNGYQSGGAYRSPAGDLQSIIYNQYLQQVAGGDLDNLNNMSWDEFSANLQAANANLFQFANDTVTNQERIASHFQQIVSSAKSLQQALNRAAEFAYRLGENQVEYSKSIHQAGGGDPDDTSTALGQMVNNAMLQSVHIQQQILNRLTGMNDALVEINQDANKNQFQEESLFDDLKQTLVNSIMHNPTAQKVGGLVSSLMSAGLFSVAANEKVPEPLRKLAMGAVYFQVPETVTMILGEVLRTVLTGWLFGKASGILAGGLSGGLKAVGGGLLNVVKTGFTGLFSGIGSLFSGAMNALSGLTGALAPLAPLLLGLAGGVAIMAVGTKIKQGIDKKIDENPNLTQEEKDKRHATNHIVGDTLTGVGAGAAIGAGIGSVVPVIGTAVGAIGGAVIGGLVGLGKGLFDSFINGWIGKDKKKDQNKQQEFAQLNDTFNEKFESLSEAINSIDENVQQILQAITTGAGAFSLFGGHNGGGLSGLVKALGEKIKNSSWWQEHVGAGGEKGGGGSSNSGAYKQYADNSTKTMWDKRAKPKANSGYEDMRTLKEKYGLKGTIAKDNSVPWLKKENVGAMLQLDSMLNQWGYDVVYTSNMGGSHAGGSKSHASGNKVDLQLFKNGKPVHLSENELNQLKAKGYWGGATGALGWEPHANQTGGGHYDLTDSASFVKVDRSNEAINSAISRYEKDQAEAKRKQQEKEAREKAVKDSKDDKKMFQNILNPISNLVQPKTSFGDVTGMNDYTRMNTTNLKLNRG